MEKLQNNNFRGCVEVLIFEDESMYNSINRDNENEVLKAKRNSYDGNVIFIYNNKIECTLGILSSSCQLNSGKHFEK